MEVLADLTSFLDKHTETGRRFGLAQLLEEFRKALVDELDYRREADNLTRMRELVVGHDLIVVPEAFADLTTSKVLAMEFVEGKKVTDLGPLAGSTWMALRWPTNSSPRTSTGCSSKASSTPTPTPATCW